MNKLNVSHWADHLASWRSFLERSIVLADDTDTSGRGEIIRLRRQLRTIERVRYGAAINPSLLSAFIRQNWAVKQRTGVEHSFLQLNESQERAVSYSLGESPLTLIQGPPGTGKTQVIAEICLEMLQSDPNARILVCSETHVAVNNLISRIACLAEQYRVVRIRDREGDGNIDVFSPEFVIHKYLTWLTSTCTDVTSARIINEELSDVTDPSLEKALALSSNIVGMTCNRIAAYNFRDASEMFDTVIIDEACKATLPEILAPLLIARKAVIVGDPMQLPPVFCSEEREIIDSIEDCNLRNYMYIDELFKRTDNVIALDTQYRMVDEIGTLISTVFYDGTLKSGRHEGGGNCIIWADYTPTKAWPLTDEIKCDRTRIYNEDECKVISKILHENIAGISPNSSVAVISPYRAQVSLLREHIHLDRVTIDTVDAFQGKECDTVIFSMTRTSGAYRFIGDKRRLNVALSRARNKIVIVGDLAYCSKNPLLSAVASFCTVQTVVS